MKKITTLMVALIMALTMSQCKKSPVDGETNEINGHQYVDLGLPSGLLWATCNIGADMPESFGDHFAWGETKTKDSYTSSNCSTYGVQMSDISGIAQYDAATANWGNEWRMPTKSELRELVKNCTWTWTTQRGVKGFKVTSKINGNHIFFPVLDASSSKYDETRGRYWTSAPNGNNTKYAWGLSFSGLEEGLQYILESERYQGRLVRPVSGDRSGGDENIHLYVDLGLSVKWATCNIGASSSEEYGDYFAWGETTTKTEYTSDNSTTFGLTPSDLRAQGIIDEEGNLTSTYDAAKTNWGIEWRMPTDYDFNELMANCTWTMTTQNGVSGYTVTSKINGNHIFLPFAGNYGDSYVYGIGNEGRIWTSTVVEGDDNTNNAYYLYISNVRNVQDYRRCYGYSIRPVFIGGLEGPGEQCALVTTAEVTEITSKGAVCGGEVITSNGSTVKEKGVCWSTSENPTIDDNRTIDGLGIGAFTSTLTDLTINTTYYVRAYATNSAGTSYGEQKSFTTALNPNGHEYVDLGLPSGLKWATCNVGASCPEDYGGFYAWGETETKESYSTSTSHTFGYAYSQLLEQGVVDEEYNLTPAHDAATVNWGGDWRMPTKEEQEELLNNCNWTWTTRNGVNGYVVTGTNGNQIFLPFAGYHGSSNVISLGENGCYWSSRLEKTDTDVAYGFKLDDCSQKVLCYYRLYIGQSIRPVIR